MAEPKLPWDSPERIAAREAAAIEREERKDAARIQVGKATATFFFGLAGVFHIQGQWIFHVHHTMDIIGYGLSAVLMLGGVWLWLTRYTHAR